METPLKPFPSVKGYSVPLCVLINGFEVDLELLFPGMQAASPHRHSTALLASNRIIPFGDDT